MAGALDEPDVTTRTVRNKCTLCAVVAHDMMVARTTTALRRRRRTRLHTLCNP